jgi:hypothetical protein
MTSLCQLLLLMLWLLNITEKSPFGSMNEGGFGESGPPEAGRQRKSRDYFSEHNNLVASKLISIDNPPTKNRNKNLIPR